jgi:anti-anti-sigma factor
MLNLPELADSTHSGVGVKVTGQSDERLVIALRGRIIANTTDDLARRVVLMCAREGWRPRIALDFSLVRQIDSIGIGAICEIHSQVTAHDSRLEIEGASPAVQKILRLMSVDSFIDLV